MWVVKKTEKGTYRRVWKLSKKTKLFLWEVACVLAVIGILSVVYLYKWGLL